MQVTQKELAAYAHQVQLALREIRKASEMRHAIETKLVNGATIEPGELTAEMRQPEREQ